MRTKKSVTSQGRVQPVLFDVLYVKDGFSNLLEEQLPVDEAVAALRKYAAQHMQDEMPTPFMIPSDVPLCDDLKPNYDEDWRQVDIDLEYSERCAMVKSVKNEIRKKMLQAQEVSA